MSLYKYFLCITLLLSFISHILAEGCEIDPFIDNAALLINPADSSIIYPEHGETVIRFARDEIVEFACPQREVLVDGTESGPIVQAICISNGRFRVNGQRFLWTQIFCSANPLPIGRYLNSNCGDNARLAEIGFDLGNDRFTRTITVCFNTLTQVALYTYFDISSSINSRVRTTPRPSFKQDNGFYNYGVNQLYTRATQRSTINGLVGLPADSVQYIETGNTLFLSRGHLVARMDFIYPAQQNATFRYINAAPQWQSFNEKNWNQVEVDSRNYAYQQNVNLQVWTGTYGVASLPHQTTGEDIPLYLYADGDKRALPVPAIYWKIVYEPISRRGIVLIGLNNPFENKVDKHVMCPDVSNQVSWLKWNQYDILAGYSYACTVANFRKVVTYAPNLSVSGCTIDIHPLDPNHPLLVKPGTNTLLYPKHNRTTITFQNKDQFELNCPGSEIKFGDTTFSSSELATCLNGAVSIENKQENMDKVLCSKAISSTARSTNKPCGTTSFEIQVGFLLDNNRFTSCFNDTDKNVLYTKFTLRHEINSQTTGNDRKSWLESTFYNLPQKLNTLYTKVTQRNTINYQLGLTADDETYIKSGNYYLAKGHLIAKADYIFNAEQLATFYYINAAPQWQSFNEKNWFAVEKRLRQLQWVRQTDLLVYTGTYGITTLPHANTKEEIPLYLYVNDDGTKAIPIPELYWKVISDYRIVVLGINNPYQTDINKSIICPDISASISWLSDIDLNDISSGYLYACDLTTFKKFLTFLHYCNNSYK